MRYKLWVMQKKRTTTLKVTDDQQKAWDFITKNWGKIISFLGILISVSFYVGWYVNQISNNDKMNDLTLTCAKEIEAVRKSESENCTENMKNYRELVEKLIPVHSKQK